MKDDLQIKSGIVIPLHEIEVKTSRAGGPGGQHVNRANTRVTIRWNVRTTNALTNIQKERVLERLSNEITNEGDVVIHNSESRSQAHNKKAAYTYLAKKIAKALHIKKKRMKTTISSGTKQARMQEKKKRSALKAMRSKKGIND